MIIDLFLIYQFLRRLVTPFKDWEAYKLGIIDERGNILIPAKERTKAPQRAAFAKFDLLVLKLKKLLEKIPGGKTRIASFAAALWLIKENDEVIENAEVITEEEIFEGISKHMTLAESIATVDERFTLFEETTQAASGVVDHSKSMGKPLKKKKPAEQGTLELVKRYAKSTPGQSMKEAHSYGYDAEPVGVKKKSADISNAKAKIKINKKTTKDPDTGIETTKISKKRTLRGKRDHVQVGHDNEG